MNPTLLRVIGSCHDLRVFSSTATPHDVDKYIQQFMAKSDLPPRFVSDRVSAFIAASGVSTGEDMSELVGHCASSVMFDGGISPTEMVRAIKGQTAYTSHTFMDLDWDGLVCAVKTHLGLAGSDG